jgi:hypothetical protein
VTLVPLGKSITPRDIHSLEEWIVVAKVFKPR